MSQYREIAEHLEAEAGRRLLELLGRVPGWEVLDLKAESGELKITAHDPVSRPDVVLSVRNSETGRLVEMIAEVRSRLRPREAREVVSQLRDHCRAAGNRGARVVPVLIVPSLSEAVSGILDDEGIAWLDFGGNVHLEFEGNFIHIEGRPVPAEYKERSPQKSLFTPKATRLLRVLLQGPVRSWKVEELAETAGVSLGLVSKVRKLLLDEELAVDSKDGIRITQAGKILTDWLRKDDFSKRTSVREYSTLVSGEELADRLIRYGASHSEEPLFTLNYAAWLRAPHNVPTVVSAYVKRFPNDDEIGYELKARPVQRGAGNLRLLVHEDHHALTIDSQRVKEGKQAVLVSDVQLYLDLHQAEPNGAEQAEVLRKLDDFSGGWA